MPSSEKKSYCPSFVLAIVGPWLCVFGGIYAEKAILQPLTDYIWLGGIHGHETSRDETVARQSREVLSAR